MYWSVLVYTHLFEPCSALPLWLVRLHESAGSQRKMLPTRWSFTAARVREQHGMHSPPRGRGHASRCGVCSRSALHHLPRTEPQNLSRNSRHGPRWLTYVRTRKPQTHKIHQTTSLSHNHSRNKLPQPHLLRGGALRLVRELLQTHYP